MPFDPFQWEYLNLQQANLILQTRILEVNTTNMVENKVTGRVMVEILNELKKLNARLDDAQINTTEL